MTGELKGLILSGGKGTRLRPFTYTGAKQLVPLANKPVLFYAIEDLVEAGITDIGIVIGDTGDQVMAAVGDGSRFGARVTYIRQDEPRGLAHGVIIARQFLGDSRFVMFLGDNFVRDGIAPLVQHFRTDDVNSMIILKEVDRPQDFGVAEMVDGRVVRLVEKPKDPKSNLAVTGIYMFDKHVWEAVDCIQPSARGELEITDTIQCLIDKGLNVQAHLLKGWWIDTGKMEDILEANRLVLETIETRIEGSYDQYSKVHGRVVLEKGAELINSVVRGPVAIGEGTRLINSYVGPFSSIYHHCTIISSEIEHSVVLEHSRIEGVDHRIEDSLIGRNVEIGKSPMKPKAYKLVLGDHSKVGLL
ncbi:MAG TPA: glucose-1-phosphate thymidylyltransferase [Dehalococcoidia bacterium]|nr:glucose-1-phosphate thymidylyltransferase [Dehalococcoidia bacterium]HLE80278.1 glucose-1-phosphate thymidylyltransferase [Dehalococcoidia bacterium]